MIIELLKKTWIFLVLVILFLSISFNIQQCRSIKDTNNQSIQNIHSLLDSMKIVKNGNHDTYIKTVAVVQELNQLKLLNESLYENIKKSEKNLNGKISTIEKYYPVFVDSSKMGTTKIQVNDSSWIANWNINNNKIYDINGKTKFKLNLTESDIDNLIKKLPDNSYRKMLLNKTPVLVYLTDVNTKLDSITLMLEIESGVIKNKKGIYEAYVTPLTPGLKIKNITGAVIDPNIFNTKNKKWGISTQAGFGTTYDIIGKNVVIGPYVGVGLSYNLFSW